MKKKGHRISSVLPQVGRVMRDGEDVNYEIIKHRRDIPGTTSVGVVKGQSAAGWHVEQLNRKLTEAEKTERWGYYSQRTTKAVTIRPIKEVAYKPDRGKG